MSARTISDAPSAVQAAPSEVAPPPSLDALIPRDMAAKAEAIGVGKAGLEGLDSFVLAVLAGAFIALGAMFATTVTAGASGELPFGVAVVGLVYWLVYVRPKQA